MRNHRTIKIRKVIVTEMDKEITEKKGIISHSG